MATKDYSTDLQKLFLEIMLSDAQCFVRVQNIFDSVNFDRSLRSAVRFMQEHVENYGDMPTLEQMKVKGSVELQDLRDNTSAHQDWFLDEFEKFCKHKGLEKAILASTDKLEKGEFGSVEKMIKDAWTESL